MHDQQVSQAASCIEAVTLGLDLTLRELQGRLKKDGHPWEASHKLSIAADDKMPADMAFVVLMPFCCSADC